MATTKRPTRNESPAPAMKTNGDAKNGHHDVKNGDAKDLKEKGSEKNKKPKGALQNFLEQLRHSVMKHTGGTTGLVISFALCAVNVFTIVLTPVIVPFLIAAHASHLPCSFWSWNKHAVSFASALGCAVGSMALHYVTLSFGKESLAQLLPENLITPTGQVAEWLESFGAVGVGLSGFFPGPIQPAIIIGALLKCNGLAVGLFLFIGRYPKNFILFESAGQAIHGVASLGKKAAAQVSGKKKAVD